MQRNSFDRCERIILVLYLEVSLVEVWQFRTVNVQPALQRTTTLVKTVGTITKRPPLHNQRCLFGHRSARGSLKSQH